MASTRCSAALGSLREGDAVGGVLRRVAAGPDAQLQPARGQLRDGGRHVRQDRRVAVHDVGHEGAQADAAGDRGRRGQHRPALQQRIGQSAAADEVVPDPGRGEAGRLGPPHGLQPPGRGDADGGQVEPDRDVLPAHGRPPTGSRVEQAPAYSEAPASSAISIMRSVARSSSSSGQVGALRGLLLGERVADGQDAGGAHVVAGRRGARGQGEERCGLHLEAQDVARAPLA